MIGLGSDKNRYPKLSVLPLQPPFVIDFRLLWGGGSFFFMSIYKAMIVNLRSYKTAIRQTSSFGYPPRRFANNGRARAYTHVLARVYSTRASTCTIYTCFTLPPTRVNPTATLVFGNIDVLILVTKDQNC